MLDPFIPTVDYEILEEEEENSTFPSLDRYEILWKTQDLDCDTIIYVPNKLNLKIHGQKVGVGVMKGILAERMTDLIELYAVNSKLYVIYPNIDNYAVNIVARSLVSFTNFKNSILISDCPVSKIDSRDTTELEYLADSLTAALLAQLIYTKKEWVLYGIDGTDMIVKDGVLDKADVQNLSQRNHLPLHI